MPLVGCSSPLNNMFPYVNNTTTTLLEPLPSASQDAKDSVYNQLWLAYIAPDVDIVLAGENLDQIQAHTDQEPSSESPALYNLHSNIPCTVIHMELTKAETETDVLETDDLRVQVTLLSEFRVGVRWSRRSASKPAVAILSARSLRNGVLSTGSIFNVYYKPRTSPQFIVPVDRYLQSLQIKFSIGAMFRWKINDEEYPYQRLLGQIAAIEDVDPAVWPGSKWRSLKVQWCAPCDAIRPDRISPWNAELLVVANNTSPVPQLHKRTCTPPRLSSVNHESMELHGTYSVVLQGRDRGAPEVGSSSGACQSQRRRLEVDVPRPTHIAPNSDELADASLPPAQSNNNKCMLFGVNLCSPVSAPASTGFSSGSTTQCIKVLTPLDNPSLVS